MEQEQPQEDKKKKDPNAIQEKRSGIDRFMEWDIHTEQGGTDGFIMSCLGHALDAWKMEKIGFVGKIQMDLVVFQDLDLEAFSKIVIENEPILKI